jgi:hypothetical protein
MTTSEKFRRLSPFEECVGPLREIFEQDGALIALIGKIHLALPVELEQSLRPLIGQKIAILRTDIPQKQYLFRVIDPEANCHSRASNSVDCLSTEKIGPGVAAPESFFDKAIYYGI